MHQKFGISALLAASFYLAAPSVQANDPVWDGNTVELVAEELHSNVYAYYAKGAKELQQKGVPLATSGGIIVGSEAVLIVDTMLNQRLNQQVQDLVAAKTDLPISYAVNTSAHGDHSYGNMYLPEQTRIVQHSNARAYVQNHFQADTEFMIQNFGAGRGIEEIVPTTGDVMVAPGGQVTIDLGDKQVEVIDFGFAQTGGDLFVWEPQSQVMWTGNAIVAGAPALPWLLDGHLLETLETLTQVHAFLPEGATVVPGHGSAIGRDGLKWHIDYLAAVKAQVQAAVDEGLTLEQTVAKVKLPEFQGYALFGWVHPGLNVPAAYKDLNGG